MGNSIIKKCLIKIYYSIYKKIFFPWNIFIEGNPRNIKIGRNCYFEKNVTLSTKYGGNITIGDNCEFYRGAIIATYGGNINIGSFTSVNYNTILYGHGNLTIGKFVRIAANVVFIPANHQYASNKIIMNQPLLKKGIYIDDNVWIGTGAIILDGVKVGKGSVIAAGTVVNKNIGEYEIHGGVPNKLIKKIDI